MSIYTREEVEDHISFLQQRRDDITFEMQKYEDQLFDIDGALADMYNILDTLDETEDAGLDDVQAREK